MSHPIHAIFDSGDFRPLEPVELAEGTKVLVQLESPTAGATDEADEETRQAWRDYLDRMESLPDRSPQDGLTNCDHDRILYGD